MSDTANAVGGVGDRTAWWLRSAGLSAKEVGRLLGASEGTGKRLRSGVTPTTEQLVKLAKHFERRFIDFVFEAVIGPSDAALAADLNEIERRLARLEGNENGVDRSDDAAVAPVAGAAAPGPGRVVAGMARPVREVKR